VPEQPDLRPLRIALVLAGSVGGIGRHVASVAPRLVARGHTVTVYAPEVTAAAQGFVALGLDVAPLSALPRLRADVVHAHGYKAAARVLPVARLRRIPLVVTWHNAVLGRGSATDAVLGRGAQAAAGRALQRLVARGADLTLGASSDLVAEADRLGARRALLAPVAAPALEPPRTSAEQRRAELGLHPADILVLTVSRLAPQKNLDLLLDLAAAVSSRSDVRFAVVGDGPLRPALAARIERERLPVTLLGRTDDVASWLRAADLALLTSTWEARALVAQEAMLAGIPVLSTRVGGMAELVGDAGTLFDLDAPEAAVGALLELADDPALRRRLADAGRQRAATWPDEDEVVTDLLRRYRQVISARRR
jgi:glycosyltransferase involved in cell wall biosynthesis